MEKDLKEIKAQIKKENWKKAEGIKYKRGETNSALAERDYSVPCKASASNLIVIIEGYWIWWCSSHHQPLAWCEKAKAIKELKEKVNKALTER